MRRHDRPLLQNIQGELTLTFELDYHGLEILRMIKNLILRHKSSFYSGKNNAFAQALCSSAKLFLVSCKISSSF